MLKNPRFAVVLCTLYLVLYCILFLAGYGDIVSVMFLLSPVLVIWMFIAVLKYGKYTGPQLDDNEEWGYQDKSREQC